MVHSGKVGDVVITDVELFDAVLPTERTGKVEVHVASRWSLATVCGRSVRSSSLVSDELQPSCILPTSRWWLLFLLL